jgi:outer membrane protein TolC
MMKTNILILSLLCSGLNAGAQQAYLSREEYRDKVEAYSQILKQQHLKTFASTEARKIASTGFLPQIDITAEGTANLNHLDQWNSPKGDYHPYTYQALATLTQPLYTGGSLIAQKKVAQAEEALDQLTTELTLDQIHYQSDAVYWNASAARAGLKAAATFQDIVQQQYDIIQDRFDDGAISRTDLLMISTRRKEAELQYIKARQNHTLALQKLNILMGSEPDAPIDSIAEIDIPTAPIIPLGLDDVLPRRAEYASTSVNIARSEGNDMLPSAATTHKSACSSPPVGIRESPIWGRMYLILPSQGSTSASPSSVGEPASRQTANRKPISAYRSCNKAM